MRLERDKGKEVGLNNKKKAKTKEKHRIDHKGMRRRRRSCGSAAVQPVLTAPAGGEPPAQQTGTHLFPKHPSGLRSSRISALLLHTISPASLQHVHHVCFHTVQLENRNRVSLVCDWGQMSPSGQQLDEIYPLAQFRLTMKN